MKLLIFSDIHDHMQHLQILLDNHPACDGLIGCGDYCSPFVIRLLGSKFSCPIHLVWGNNDGDRALQVKVASHFPHLHLEGESYEGMFASRRIFVNHYPQIARPVAASGHYDLVLYGHDHRRHEEHVGYSTLLNPGSVMGYQPADHTYHTPTVAVYDTDSGKSIFYPLGE